MSYMIRPLDASTWDAFAEVVEAQQRPDWRITRFYVDRKYSRPGHRAGDAGRRATVELFEQCGFTRGRQVGKQALIVSSVVDPV
ncbi:MAG: hypothetical protein H0V07_12615 [Propionibacteriales bacterium]|nr:hypothetical protein [Propionibacteriales bacterium]